MRVRHSFSARHNRKTKNIRKQRGKYPEITKTIIDDSEVVLEVLDSRFIEETRNEDFEEIIKKKNKKIIYVFNKSDLIDTNKMHPQKKMIPSVFVSSTKRKGIRELRDRIKIESKKVNRKDKTNNEKITVGVIGYPNTGKSSLINALIGKSSAGVGSDAGFTRNLQKIKLSENIVLIDSPGVIPEKEYSAQDKEKIAIHTKLGARSYSQVKDPELVISNLMRDYSKILEKFYKINAKGDAEVLLEKLGKKKGFIKKGGEVNEDTTARLILKDWQSGKIKI